jgi:hypothetical protein
MLSADLPKFISDSLEDPIYIFDNDETGIKKAINIVNLTKGGNYENGKNVKVFVWPKEWKNFKDLNEVLCSGYNREVILETVNNNIFQGLEAEIRLNLL